MSINVRVIGEGKPLVLFHGWGFDSQIWTPLISNLISNECKYKLYLVDLPGFGSSSYTDWNGFKKSLLPQLPEKFSILGWSMGGLYATRLSIEEPHKVNNLVNVASSPYFINSDNWVGIDNQVFNSFYSQLLDNPTQTRVDFIKNHLRTDSVPSNIMETSPTEEGLQAGLDLLVNWDLRPQLAQLKLPVYYLFGKLDPLIPRRVMKMMQELHPEFKYVMFDRAAHIPFLSHSQQFLKVLTEVNL
ncbi:MAG: alpha/beta fold hydrolase [Legionellaceae bacterium]|nr:alpha/beta fold hydrolase [Legionellaceae bacterium]